MLAFADLAGRVVITALVVWLTAGVLVALKRDAPIHASIVPALAKMLIAAGIMAFCSSFIWLFSFRSLSETLRDELYGPVVGDDVQTHESPRLARVASLLAGRRTAVSCFSREDWDDRVRELRQRPLDPNDLPGRFRAAIAYTINHPGTGPAVGLSAEVCAELNPLLSGSNSMKTAQSLDVFAPSINALAHESVHASGIHDEAKTNCFGIQTIRRTMMLLGRTSGEGQHVATYFYDNLYPLQAPRYRSPECRNGGRLDRHRNRSTWP
jgi:hypothetical protein